MQPVAHTHTHTHTLSTTRLSPGTKRSTAPLTRYKCRTAHPTRYKYRSIMQAAVPLANVVLHVSEALVGGSSTRPSLGPTLYQTLKVSRIIAKKSIADTPLLHA
eukprot:345010-Rhodomonas_salina.1